MGLDGREVFCLAEHGLQMTLAQAVAKLTFIAGSAVNSLALSLVEGL